MSKFDIHKWNSKRRLAALNEYSGEGPYKLKFQSPSIEDPLRTIYNRLTQLVNRNGTFRASTVAPTTDGAKEQFDFWVRAILKDADGLNQVPYIDRSRALRIKNKIEGANLTVPQILNLIREILNEGKIAKIPEPVGEVDLGRQGAVEIAREQALHDLQDAVKRAGDLKAINSFERAALDTLLVRAIKRRASERGDI